MTATAGGHMLGLRSASLISNLSLLLLLLLMVVDPSSAATKRPKRVSTIQVCSTVVVGSFDATDPVCLQDPFDPLCYSFNYIQEQTRALYDCDDIKALGLTANDYSLNPSGGILGPMEVRYTCYTSSLMINGLVARIR